MFSLSQYVVFVLVGFCLFFLFLSSIVFVFSHRPFFFRRRRRRSVFAVVITLDSKDTLYSWQNEAHRIE